MNPAFGARVLVQGCFGDMRVANGWRWYSVRYRRQMFGRVEVMVQLGKSAKEAVASAKLYNPTFHVIDATPV
jgi:hypothetical protein